MQIELIEIRDHLNRFAPFDNLPEQTLDTIASQVQVGYYKAGSEILAVGAPIHELHYVRSGAVEIHRRGGELHNRLSEGDIFGQAGLLRGNKVRLGATAIEDSLIYFIPGALFHQLCEQFDSFADFVEAEGQSRLKSALEDSHGKASELMKIKVRKLISRGAVSVPLDTPIQQVAQVMTEHSVSSVIVVDPGTRWPDPHQVDVTEQQTQVMAGILTDRDLRTRVVAAGLASDTPVSQIMTPNPITLQADDSVFEAMLCMLRNNIHHLPVLQRRRPVGMISLADVIRYESRSSLYLVNSIFNKTSVEGLKSLLPDLRATFVRMVADDASAHMVGSAMSGIGRAFSQRLLELETYRAMSMLGLPRVRALNAAMNALETRLTALVERLGNEKGPAEPMLDELLSLSLRLESEATQHGFRFGATRASMRLTVDRSGASPFAASHSASCIAASQPRAGRSDTSTTWSSHWP